MFKRHIPEWHKNKKDVIEANALQFITTFSGDTKFTLQKPLISYETLKAFANSLKTDQSKKEDAKKLEKVIGGASSNEDFADESKLDFLQRLSKVFGEWLITYRILEETKK